MYNILFMVPLCYTLSRRKKYQKRKKYSPSDVAAANNREAIEMDTLPNTAALKQDTDGPVATTGASTTPASPAGVTTSGTVVNPFNLTEDQIKSQHEMFSFRPTGPFDIEKKK